MASEIEAKVRAADPSALERALEKLGAEDRGTWLETDSFLDHPDERLRRHDTALRLRWLRPLDRAASAIGASALLTYKGPREAGRVKIREEHQVAVPDPDAMVEILHGLGYVGTFCYEKRRHRWQLQGAEVTFDEVPRLGTFVEVEAANEDEVDRLLDALGFPGAERITTTYLEMLREKLGDESRGGHVRFEDGRSAGDR